MPDVNNPQIIAPAIVDRVVNPPNEVPVAELNFEPKVYVVEGIQSVKHNSS